MVDFGVILMKPTNLIESVFKALFCSEYRYTVRLRRSVAPFDEGDLRPASRYESRPARNLANSPAHRQLLC